MKTIVLGGGCFWCLDALYRRVKGVEKVVSGYAGGDYDNPTYQDLHYKDTNHAEVVELTYNESVISLETILDMFWQIHNPTTIDRQGNDVGSEYRSIILYGSDEEGGVVKKSLKEVAQKIWSDPVATEVKPLNKFWPAEDYHQDYFNKNPGAGYCQFIINPKIDKFEKTFASYLK